MAGSPSASSASLRISASRSTYSDPGASISAKFQAVSTSAMPVTSETCTYWPDELWDVWREWRADLWSEDASWYGGEREERTQGGLAL